MLDGLCLRGRAPAGDAQMSEQKNSQSPWRPPALFMNRPVAREEPGKRGDLDPAPTSVDDSIPRKEPGKRGDLGLP